MRKILLWGLPIVIAVVAVAYAAGALDGEIEDFKEARQQVLEKHWGLSTCGSRRGLALALQTVNSSLKANKADADALTIANAQTIAIAPQQVDCQGEVYLSIRKKMVLKYVFTPDPSGNKRQELVRISTDGKLQDF